MTNLITKKQKEVTKQHMYKLNVTFFLFEIDPNEQRRK